MHFPACHSFPLSLVPLLFTPRSIAAPTYQVESIGKSVLDGSTQLRHALPEDSFSYERLHTGTTSTWNQREPSQTGNILFEQANHVLDSFVKNPEPLWIDVQSPDFRSTLHSSAETVDESHRQDEKETVDELHSQDEKDAISNVVKDIFRVKAYSQFKLDNQDQKRMEAHMEQFLSRLPEFNEITPKLEQIVTTWKKRLIEVEPSSINIQQHVKNFHSQFHAAFRRALSDAISPDMEAYLLSQFSERFHDVRDQLEEIQEWTDQKTNKHMFTTLSKVAEAALQNPQLFIKIILCKAFEN